MKSSKGSITIVEKVSALNGVRREGQHKISLAFFAKKFYK